MWPHRARRGTVCAGRCAVAVVAGRSTESLDSTVSSDNDWELFQTFTDIGSAEVMCAWLLSEEVPARVDTQSFESSLEIRYRLWVRRDLIHRARWVIAQPAPTETELEYLATGKLPNAEEK